MYSKSELIKQDINILEAEAKLEKHFGHYVYISFLLDRPVASIIKRTIIEEDIYILECIREATEHELDKLDLEFVGRGSYDSENIREILRKKFRV